jgi:hypothetical protein
MSHCKHLQLGISNNEIKNRSLTFEDYVSASELARIKPSLEIIPKPDTQSSERPNPTISIGNYFPRKIHTATGSRRHELQKGAGNLWFQSTVMQYDAFLCEFQLVHFYHQIPYRTSKKLYVVFYHKKWSMIELVSHLSCGNGSNVTPKARVAIVKVSRGS